jgi:1,2-diacylglycerol 3-alpha-glucosyltransferase
MRISLLFDNFGPYHQARAAAASVKCELSTIEFSSLSGTYEWKPARVLHPNHRILNKGGRISELSGAVVKRSLFLALHDTSPDLVMIPGWGTREARLALAWCIRSKVPAVVMSESTSWDMPRNKFNESIKLKLVGMFSAALVGGIPHRAYVHQLGMPEERIFTGYNVVENAYFASESLKHQSTGQPSEGLANEETRRHQPFFLASNRFIERKNLLRLIEAYAGYAHRGQGSGGRNQEQIGQLPSTNHNAPNTPWHLCLLGDGEQKAALIAKCRDHGLEVIESAPWEAIEKVESGKRKVEMVEEEAASSFQLSAFARPTVYLPGFRQIDGLPRFYAQAGCFIHPALTEPWGLVVNEAMACGLPVLVSERVGCAKDLVQDGVNGFTFDPQDVGRISELMGTIASMDFPRDQFGTASRRIVDRFSPDAFAAGLEAAARKAIEVGPAKPSLIDRLLLEALCRVR